MTGVGHGDGLGGDRLGDDGGWLVTSCPRRGTQTWPGLWRHRRLWLLTPPGLLAGAGWGHVGDTGLVTVQGEGWICPQCAGGSQEPLDVSVGLMLMLVTSSKNEQKKGRRGKMTWSIGGPVRGWQHLLSPRGHSGIQRSAGRRIPRELLPIPVPSLSHPSGTSRGGDSHGGSPVTPAWGPWGCHGDTSAATRHHHGLHPGTQGTWGRHRRPGGNPGTCGDTQRTRGHPELMGTPEGPGDRQGSPEDMGTRGDIWRLGGHVWAPGDPTEVTRGTGPRTGCVACGRGRCARAGGGAKSGSGGKTVFAMRWAGS